jgi:hypothetical protein
MTNEAGTNERTYVILNVGASGNIHKIDEVDGSSPEQAVRRSNALTGTFVAVPKRNWSVIQQTSEPQPPKITGALLTGDAADEVFRVPPLAREEPSS